MSLDPLSSESLVASSAMGSGLPGMRAMGALNWVRNAANSSRAASRWVCISVLRFASVSMSICAGKGPLLKMPRSWTRAGRLNSFDRFSYSAFSASAAFAI